MAVKARRIIYSDMVRRNAVEARNLLQEIDDLEKSNNIKVLGIETIDGVLSRSAVETAIDSLKDTLGKINLDEIAKSVDHDIKEFAIA
jgi:hypothetical protein